MIYRRIGKPIEAKNCHASGLRAIDGQKLIVIEGALVLRMAEVLVDEGAYEEALRLLDRHAADIDVSAFHRFLRYRLTAGIFARRGNLEQAATALEPGLTLAFIHQYDAWILQDDSWITPVLLTAHRLGFYRDYIERCFREAGHGERVALQALKRSADSRMRRAAGRVVAMLPEESPRSLTIRCLGKFGACVDGVEIPLEKWRSKAATLLFKFLVMKAGQGFIPKDTLLEFLWPEENPDITNKRFHVALSTLRRLLEPGLKRGVSSALKIFYPCLPRHRVPGPTGQGPFLLFPINSRLIHRVFIVSSGDAESVAPRSE
jgi:hypothetical protein